MTRPLPLLWPGSAALLLLALMALRSLDAPQGRDGSASLHNGAPAGWLALARLAAHAGRPMSVATAVPTGPGTLWIPPPARRTWDSDEVSALLRAAEQSEMHLIVVCDDERAGTDRLRPLLVALDVECRPGTSAGTRATSAWPGYPEALAVVGPGRVEPGPSDLVLWRDEVGEAVVVRRALGRATLTVIGSGSLLRNEGLLSGDNVAFAWRLLASGEHRVDESHHHLARAALLAELGRRPSLRIALFAALTLPLLAALSLAPRPGDAPRSDPSPPFSPARAAVSGLAAWARMARPPLPPPPPLPRRSPDP